MPVSLTSESFIKDLQTLCEKLGFEVTFVDATHLKYQEKWMRFPTPRYATITEPYKSRFFGIRRHRDVAYVNENGFKVYLGHKKEPELLAGLRQVYSHYSGLPEEKLQGNDVDLRMLPGSELLSRFVERVTEKGWVTEEDLKMIREGKVDS